MKKSGTLLKCMFISLFPLTSTNGLYAQTPPAVVIQDIQSILDNARVYAESPGAVLTIDIPGTWSYTWGSGVRDLASGVPADGSEMFRSGSVTKNFIAAAILKLVNEQVLSLDDTLANRVSPVIAAAIPNADLITIRQLLNHTSGLADYIDDSNSTFNILNSFAPVFANYTFDSLVLNYLEPLSPTGAPSANHFSYTNSGYLLLSEIISQASGMSYKDYIRQSFIEPFGLMKTDFPDSAQYNLSAPYLEGYYYLNASNPYYNVTGEDVSYVQGCGDLFSSTEDLTAYFAHLLNGDFLPLNWIDSMTRFSMTDANYGYGCLSVSINGTDWIGHDGGIAGYTSFMGYIPNFNAYIAYDFNYDDADITLLILQLNQYLETLLTVEENEVATTVIAPNPATDFFYLEHPDGEIRQLSIRTPDGKIIVEKESCLSGEFISTATIPAGIYWVFIEEKCIGKLMLE